ncbi:hypothetical protein OC844_006629 [Tilletia horrida]|nr:hypothetical protein OC844_006629 [Tilletia horrida]
MKRFVQALIVATVALANAGGAGATPLLQPRQQDSTTLSVPTLTALPTSSATATATASSSSSSSSSSTQSASSTPGPSSTPGFVNNGTVGTYPCALPAELAASFGQGSTRGGAGGNGSLPVDGGGGNDPGAAANGTSASMSRVNQFFTGTLPTLSAITGYSSSASASPASATSTSTISTPSSSAAAPFPTSAGQAQQQVVYSVDTGFSSSAECSGALPPVYPYNSIRLRAPDDSIRATFLPYAATLSELWVKDQWGQWRDVVVGFDNKVSVSWKSIEKTAYSNALCLIDQTNYGTDTIHPDFGPVVGRYANRIKNGSFVMDGVQYNTTLNENGVDTLHGGNPGYDRSAFTVADIGASNVTFKLQDPAGNQGFPHAVDSQVIYSLNAGGTLSIRMNATASGRTPIMLSSHVYWQLEGYNATEGRTILDHVFHLPKADKYIETDSILIPTGPIPNVTGTAYDFLQPKTFRSLFNQTEGICGAGCQGWDSCFVMSEHERDEPVIELWSTKSGIKLSVTTDQPALQVYTCDGVSSPTKGSLPRKVAHGGDGTLDEIYENHSCVVLEAQDYIDAVNHPEWGRDVIYSPDRPYVWQADYSFSILS